MSGGDRKRSYGESSGSERPPKKYKKKKVSDRIVSRCCVLVNVKRTFLKKNASNDFGLFDCRLIKSIAIF